MHQTCSIEHATLFLGMELAVSTRFQKDRSLVKVSRNFVVILKFRDERSVLSTTSCKSSKFIIYGRNIKLKKSLKSLILNQYFFEPIKNIKISNNCFIHPLNCSKSGNS